MSLATRESQVAPASRTVESRRALKFVVLLGIVSLFADMTYEGARSITGPYLAAIPCFVSAHRLRRRGGLR